MTQRDASVDANAAVRAIIIDGDLRTAAEIVNDYVADPEAALFVRRLLLVMSFALASRRVDVDELGDVLALLGSSLVPSDR
jgi:hypothetical protein